MYTLFDSNSDGSSTGSIESFVSNGSNPVKDEESYIGYKKCLCGRCSVLAFVEGKISRCPNSTEHRYGSSLQRTAERTSPAEIKYSAYQQVIKRRFQVLQSSFNKLMQNTKTEFESRFQLKTVIQKLQHQLNPPDSSSCLYDRICRTDVKRSRGLSEVKTFGHLQEYLIDNFCSWFNIDLVADLRRVLLGHGACDNEILNYEEQLEIHVRRCCYDYTVCSTHNDSCCCDKKIVCETSYRTDLRKIRSKQVDILVGKLQSILCISDCESRVDEANGNLVLTEITMMQEVRAPHEHLVR